MKAKVFILAMAMGLTTIMTTQAKENGKKDFSCGSEQVAPERSHKDSASKLILTDAQKEAFKQSMQAMQKELQPIRSELNEAKAFQKTMTIATGMVNIINNNIKIDELEGEMAQIQSKFRSEMRAQLTNDQRFKSDFMKQRMAHATRTQG